MSFVAFFCRVVEHLLRNDAIATVRDNQGYNSVHYAALTGHKLALEMLLDTSCELLARIGPNPPTTALHIAVSTGLLQFTVVQRFNGLVFCFRRTKATSRR